MYRIVTNTFERKLYYKNTVVLKYKIEYPQILGNSFGIHRFNRFNFIKAIKLKQYSEKNLFKEAKELYDFNVSNGYPVMVYEIISDFTVTLNKKPCISIYSDDYMFTGGVHGTTTRTSQNWNIQTGNQINLAIQKLMIELEEKQQEIKKLKKEKNNIKKQKVYTSKNTYLCYRV